MYNVKISAEHGFKIPSKRDSDAGYDFNGKLDTGDIAIVMPGNIIMLNSGIRTAFSEDLYLSLAENKSSIGSIGLIGLCGVIDSGYRGIIKLPFSNVGDNAIILHHSLTDDILNQFIKALNKKGFGNDKIRIVNLDKKAVAQGIFRIVPKINLDTISVDELVAIPSIRGEGGFGSTDSENLEVLKK